MQAFNVSLTCSIEPLFASSHFTILVTESNFNIDLETLLVSLKYWRRGYNFTISFVIVVTVQQIQRKEKGLEGLPTRTTTISKLMVFFIGGGGRCRLYSDTYITVNVRSAILCGQHLRGWSHCNFLPT